MNGTNTPEITRRYPAQQDVLGAADLVIAARVAKFFLAHGASNVYIHSDVACEGYGGDVKVLAELTELSLVRRFYDEAGEESTARSRFQLACKILSLDPEKELLEIRLGKTLSQLCDEEEDSYRAEMNGDMTHWPEMRTQHRAFAAGYQAPTVDPILVEEGWYQDLSPLQQFSSKGLDPLFGYRASHEALEFDPLAGGFMAPNTEREWRLGRAKFLWNYICSRPIMLTSKHGLVLLKQELRDDISLAEIGTSLSMVMEVSRDCTELHRSAMPAQLARRAIRDGNIDETGIQKLRDAIAFAGLEIELVDVPTAIHDALVCTDLSDHAKTYFQVLLNLED